jgi:hypothetical protein
MDLFVVVAVGVDEEQNTVFTEEAQASEKFDHLIENGEWQCLVLAKIEPGETFGISSFDFQFHGGEQIKRQDFDLDLDI